jgi:hypothetical protein
MSSISSVNFSSSSGVLLFTAYSETVSRASVDCIQTVIFTTSEHSDKPLSVTNKEQNVAINYKIPTVMHKFNIRHEV